MITIHSPLNQLPGLCSRLCVTSSGTPWLSQSLLSFAYLKFKYKVEMDPVLIMDHDSPLLAQRQRVAPLELLVRLSVLVQVGRRHVATLGPAAEHRDLTLFHFQEHAGA